MEARSISKTHFRVAIVGSGFGGLGAAIRLKREGAGDFVVFERAAEVGGVWRDNRYPGAACDVESRLYSFSFAPNPDWSRRFAGQPEILAYLRRCADRFGLRPHLRLGHDVHEAAWDDETARWRIETSQGTYTADVFVAAPGGLAEPFVPDLPGRHRFQGAAFHSSRWDPAVEIEGQRVAVIGTGASAIQIVPAIQPVADAVTVFQRTPPWIIPRDDRALSERFRHLLKRWPVLQRALRTALYCRHEAFGLAFRHPPLARLAQRFIAQRHLERQVADPVLRKKLTPGYLLGCKRILLSDDYYPALQKPNVALVDGGAKALRPHGVVGADGTEHAADVVVYATGFRVTDFPFAERIRGRSGKALAEAWRPSMKAHLGTTVVGFPNLFVLQGPNTGLGHNSVVLMIEAQVEHIIGALRYMARNDVAVVEPRPEAQAGFVEEVERRMEGTVWTAGGCRSWYLDATGRNATLWPGSVGAFRRRVEPFRAEEYHLRRSDPAAHPPPDVAVSAYA